ncbi:MAG: 1,4-alpha-glucan branching protein domain-containing protein [Candidatus Aminicenantales bacterium]
MNRRYFCLVLHSHIPFVLAHGSWPHGMDWLYEAAAESYLPLLEVLFRLVEEGVSPQINISFTPVLADQLKNKNFQKGFDDYLRMKITAACEDHKHFLKTGNKELYRLAVFWEDWYKKRLRNFHEKFHGDIIRSFRTLQDEGQIEILTSAATHAYFPLLSHDESIQHQILQGRHVYRRFFGQEARGFWLPECAYRPGYAWKRPFGPGGAYLRQGVDEVLKKGNLKYFFVDSHLLKGGEAQGVYMERFPSLKLLWEKYREEYSPPQESLKDPYFPYVAHPSHMAFLVRDEVSGIQVWSRSTGYPGDEWYLEFHKKHFPGGMRYWRITSSGSDLAVKEPYDLRQTQERLEAHSSHFVHILHEALKAKSEGVIVALYDTELFGHWWFEGPEWLYLVLKKLSQSAVQPMAASRCLEHIPPRTIISLPEGSWGKGGFHWIWLNEDTSWIWEKIYQIEEDAVRLKKKAVLQNQRVLRQFFREKFLLESSDWPFLVSTWSARDYAEARAAEHFQRASTLAGWLSHRTRLSPAEETLLKVWEKEDHLFEEITDSDGQPI